jgi:hypothetical protein
MTIDKLEASLIRLDAINARMNEIEGMIEGMEFGDRRDGLESEYDHLLDQLFHFNDARATLAYQ